MACAQHAKLLCSHNHIQHTHTHTSCTKLPNPPSAAPSAVNGPILSHRTQPSPPYRCVQPSSASSSSRAGLIAEQHAEDCWRSALDAACGSRAMHMHRREFKWPGLDLSGLGGPTSVPGEDKSIFCCRMNVATSAATGWRLRREGDPRCSHRMTCARPATMSTSAGCRSGPVRRPHRSGALSMDSTLTVCEHVIDGASAGSEPKRSYRRGELSNVDPQKVNRFRPFR